MGQVVRLGCRGLDLEDTGLIRFILNREIFFADERVVPLDHEDSNFLANDNHLFSKVPIPRENIHVIDTSQLDNPEEVADEYEKQMIATFVGSNAIAFPRFDLILLGIG